LDKSRRLLEDIARADALALMTNWQTGFTSVYNACRP